MKLETFAIALLILLLAFFGGWYLYDRFGEQIDEGLKTVQEPAPAPGSKELTPEPPRRLPLPPRHPVALPEKEPESGPGEKAPPPFPDNLNESDAYLSEQSTRLITSQELRSLLIFKHFIQKLVVTVDNLTEAQVPRQHLPLRPPGPGFLTIGSGDEQLISKANERRYRPYVELFEAVPDQVLLHIYRGLYPLFQQAYRQTGSPTGYFNDRLIQVIDHLLATPELDQPIKVVRHIRRFKFAAPGLESRSAGQKMLLRCGQENMRRVKQKLRSLRQGLIGPGAR